MIRDPVKHSLMNNTIVKISKNYIVGLVFEVDTHPVDNQPNNCIADFASPTFHVNDFGFSFTFGMIFIDALK